MNSASKQQSWVHRNPAGSRRTQQLGSGKPSKARLDETQQGSSEPRLGSGKPSQASPLGLIGTQQGRPSQAGFDETQPCWVRWNPARSGFRQTQIWLGLPEASKARSPQTQQGWVPTRPSRLGSDEIQQAGFVAAIETQGRKERKKKKEGEEEGLGG
ncbi:hypothetical protein SLEP1_g7058 [Rubroshorea leprosula]|uniref:Uncharacterized protein n=1 Tax=Rubroshorea leprosula TaxID=152421 RepID=A0AAV5I676_9ROSI|nr:hypothetical protein SLEP1_g7058 [Rubroshorea leprosula]